jgi:hypothetical protein
MATKRASALVAAIISMDLWSLQIIMVTVCRVETIWIYIGKRTACHPMMGTIPMAP